MEVSCRLRLFSVWLTFVFVAGCTGGASVPRPTSPGPQESATQLVPALTGATLLLPSGASVVIPPQALSSDQTLSFVRNPADTPNPQTKYWAAATGSETLTFQSPLPPTPKGTNPPSLTFTLPYASTQAAAILAARAPVLEITQSNGATVRVSGNATFDTTRGTATVSIPRAALDGATSVKFYLALDDGTLATPSPGPRYWNLAASPPAWQSTPIALDPTQRTVVMVHGIFSSVETAFPCESSIIAAGNYGQAVGLDYDWTQPPAYGASRLAAFINSLNVPAVDIWAHSYGTVVTLAALPSITKTIGHVVLLGGPLPLNGAPQADAGFWLDLVLAGAFIASPVQVYEAYSSGMIASLATNSPVMQQINSAVRALALPPFVQVAGASPLPQETSNLAIEVLYTLYYGGTTNDGVVEQQSALTQFSPATSAVTFVNLDHIQLECDPGLIDYVGPLVNH